MDWKTSEQNLGFGMGQTENELRKKKIRMDKCRLPDGGQTRNRTDVGDGGASSAASGLDWSVEGRKTHEQTNKVRHALGHAGWEGGRGERGEGARKNRNRMGKG